MLYESMEHELISRNSDMALACERGRSSLIDPLLTPPAAAPLLRVKINERFDSLVCQGPGILMTDVLFPDILFWELREVAQGTFSVILETARCLWSRITWMRRLENCNFVRHVAAVTNGLLRMCVDVSVENSVFPHRPFRLQPWT